MITFSQYLIESLDRSVPYNWKYKHVDQWVAEFKVDDLEYIVIIGQDEDSTTRWDAVFDVKNRSVDDKLYGLTGTGNAFVVFSTVTQILTEFAHTNTTANTIVFTADEPSRQRFYDRWATQLARVFGGWQLKVLPRAVRKYILTRPQ